MIDLVFSIFGILIVLPLLPIIALLIKLDSKGPVFYKCPRVGFNEKIFYMFKFRTMVDNLNYCGPNICPSDDVRVTRLGKLLRRTKINELPQLFNILKGEMSFVGPRPEAPDLADAYPAEAKIIFAIKPGLVGPSQIINRNEEDFYPEGVDPVEYYINHILPAKLAKDCEYFLKPSLFKDAKYIFLGIKKTLTGIICHKHLFENKSQIYLFILDFVSIMFCYFLSIWLRFQGNIESSDERMFLHVFLIVLFYRIICFIGFGLYGVLIRYLSIYNYIAVTKAITLSSLMAAVTAYAVGYQSFPRSLFIIDWFCLHLFMIFARVPARIFKERRFSEEEKNKKSVLIFGAGDKGNIAAIAIKDSVNIVGFLDDDRAKRNKFIHNYRVLGGRYDIEALAKMYPIDYVIIATSNIDKHNLKQIITLCKNASLGYSIFSTSIDVHKDRTGNEYINDKKISKWIGEVEFKIDPTGLRKSFSEKVFMLNGPSPALCLELLKYISMLDTKEVIILDRYESYLNKMYQQSIQFYPNQKIRPYLIFDPIFEKEKNVILENGLSNIVIHMGTRKFPYQIKEDPLQIVRVNLLNSWYLFQNAEEAGADLFIMTSSINAAKPKNFIQATLKLSEYYIQSAEKYTRIKSGIARLHNIANNPGSIVRAVQNQLREGSRIILNHPDEQCYFSTVSTATKFILLVAIMASQNEDDGNNGIYMHNICNKIKVLNIVKLMCQECGLDPEIDIDIEYIGDKSPELWIENIQDNGETLKNTMFENIKRVVPSYSFDRETIEKDIYNFQKFIETNDRHGAVSLVKKRIEAAA
jgi:FlaA1/EpsC-like NDP-sugar epimerase/lipopolysaccharide/colanic/teichoic acid biosynthesis glycosyltransferase